MKSFEHWLKLSENKSKSPYKTYKDKDNDTIIEIPVNGNKSEFFIMNLEDSEKEMKFILKADPKAWVKSKDGFLYLVSDIQKRVNKVTETKDVTDLKAGDKVEITKTGERAKIVSKVDSTNYIVKTKGGEERRVNLNAITPIISIGKANESIAKPSLEEVNAHIQTKYPKLEVLKHHDTRGSYYWNSEDDVVGLYLAGLYSSTVEGIANTTQMNLEKWMKEADEIMKDFGKSTNESRDIIDNIRYDLKSAKEELKDLEEDRKQLNIDMELDSDINNPDEKTANDYGDKFNIIDIKIGDIKSKIATLTTALSDEQNKYEKSFNSEDFTDLENFLRDFENKYSGKYKTATNDFDEKEAKFTINVDGEDLLFKIKKSGAIFWIDFSQVYMGDLFTSTRGRRRGPVNEEDSFFFNFDELITTDPNKLDDFVNARKMRESVTNEGLNVGDEIFFPWTFHNKHLASRGGYIEKIEDGLAYLNMHDNSNKEDMFIPVPVSQIEELINTKNNESMSKESTKQHLSNYASINLKPFEHYLRMASTNESVDHSKWPNRIYAKGVFMCHKDDVYEIEKIITSLGYKYDVQKRQGNRRASEIIVYDIPENNALLKLSNLHIDLFKSEYKTITNESEASKPWYVQQSDNRKAQSAENKALAEQCIAVLKTNPKVSNITNIHEFMYTGEGQGYYYSFKFDYQHPQGKVTSLGIEVRNDSIYQNISFVVTSLTRDPQKAVDDMLAYVDKCPINRLR